MWNIILMLPTLVVGYYGMNVALPFADHVDTGIVIFALIMALLVGYAIFVAVRRRII
jgi:magnesium transporter